MKRMDTGFHTDLTFRAGCEKHLLSCKQRNLSDGAIRHYSYAYKRLYRFFDPEMPLVQMSAMGYKRYAAYLHDRYENDATINTYLRDFMVLLRFWMEEGDVVTFRMKGIKAAKSAIETYSEDELRRLLAKPNMKECTFREYEGWVMVNFLFGTGVRQRSLINVRVRDIDFENALVNIRVTKNGKVLILPLNKTLLTILNEFLRYRKHRDDEDYLFCNVFGQQLPKNTCYRMLADYNRSRGVQTTGIHRFRHTFAKQWILNGGNVVALSRLLGHSSLNITQNYINLLTTDLSKQVEEINLLDKYAARKRIKM